MVFEISDLGEGAGVLLGKGGLPLLRFEPFDFSLIAGNLCLEVADAKFIRFEGFCESVFLPFPRKGVAAGKFQGFDFGVE